MRNSRTSLGTKTLPIRVAQLNAQRKKHTVINLLNNFCADFDIIILQEPPWGRIGSKEGQDVMGPVAVAGWTPIIPVTSPTQDRPRTMTYHRTRPDFTITLRTDIVEDKDVQILDISQPGHPMTTIINIYNDTPAQNECILRRLQLLDIPNDHPTIITGDFNLHHDLWSKIEATLTDVELTEQIVDWLSSKGFVLLNEKGQTTHPARQWGT